MSVADLHYSVGSGECRDTDKEGCVGDPDTATWLGEALDGEQPDLVVRTATIQFIFPIHQQPGLFRGPAEWSRDFIRLSLSVGQVCTASH